MHVKYLVLASRKKLKKIHLQFCKKMNIPTTAVYGELGPYPLYISRSLRIPKYWLRLIKQIIFVQALQFGILVLYTLKLHLL